jgi:hypothetical protein
MDRKDTLDTESTGSEDRLLGDKELEKLRETDVSGLGTG